MKDAARFDHALLISLSNGLGSWLRPGDVDEEGREATADFYKKDVDCLACLKDLQRFLRKDDPDTRDVFFKLGAFDTARKDLVPLLIHYPQDHAIVYNSLKVLTFLTMPINPTSARPQEQLQIIDKIKEAFLLPPFEGAMTVVADVAAAALARHPRMSEEEACSVQLVLTFLRNLLFMPEVQVTRAEGRNDKLQQALFKNLFESDVMELLLVVAQHAGERPFRSEMALLLDIFHQIYRGIDPEALLQAQPPQPAAPRPSASSRTSTQQTQQQRQQHSSQKHKRQNRCGQADDEAAQAMKNLLAAETAKKAAVLAAAPRWHARNPARFVRQHVEHSRPVFLAKPQISELPELHVHVPATSSISLDGAEAGPGGSQLGPLWMWRLRQWTDELCNSDGYNTLMRVVMKEAEPGLGISRLAAGDFARLMRVARFFTAYARVKQEARQAKQQEQEAREQQQRKAAQKAAQQATHAGDAGSDAEPAGGAATHRAARQAPRTGDAVVEHVQRESADPLLVGVEGGVPVWQNQQQQQQQQAGGVPSAEQQAEGGMDSEQQQQQQQQQEGQKSEQQKAEEAEAASPFASIASTMGWNTFYLVLTSWLGQVDVPAKSELKDWDLQHASLSLLREMLAVLELAERVGNMADRRAADKLQRRLLSDDMKESGLLSVLSRLMRSFNAKHQPRSHAVDIIQSMHSVLKMYDRLCAAEGGRFVVRRKAHGGGGRRKEKAQQQQQQQEEGEEEQREGSPGAGQEERTGDGKDGDEARNNGTTTNGAAEQNEDRIREASHAEGAQGQEGGGGTDGADAREGGREDGEEGAQQQQRQQHEAPASPAGSVSRSGGSARDGAGGGAGGAESGGGAEKDEEQRRDPFEELEEEEEWQEDGGDPDQKSRRVKEAVFDLNRRLRQELATPATIHFYNTQGLVFYAHNSPATNAAITALLDRISSPDALDLEPMLYQISVLRVMHKILADRSLRTKAKLPAYQGMLRLCTRVVRNLMAKLVPDLASEEVPAQGAAKTGNTDKEGGGSDSDSLEIEGDGGSARKQQEGVESSSVEERRRTVVFENKVKSAISSMLCVDLMFWKTALVAEEINNDYFLRFTPEPAYNPKLNGTSKADGSMPVAGAGRSLRAWDEEDEDAAAGGAAAEHSSQDEGGQGHARTRGAGNGSDSEDHQQQGREGAEKASAAGKEGGAKPGRAMGAEALMQQREALRKAHFKQSKRTGSTAAPKKPQLKPEQVEQLVGLFERYNAHKTNMDVIVEAMGGTVTKGQVAHELRALGFKFGHLTPNQLTQLCSLYGRYRLERDMSTLIAAELSGGWTSRQVTRLLKKHRLTEEDEEDGGDEGEGDDDVRVGNDDVAGAFMLHKGREDVLEKVAEELGGALSPHAVLRRLRKLKLVRGSSSRKAQGSGSGKVPVGQLQELYEQFKGQADMLNRIAAHLPGTLSAKQVQRLLKKHEILVDEGVVRKKARVAEERARLMVAYQRHRLKPNHLEAIAEDMPGIVTVPQVLRLLRKHGLVDGGLKRSRQMRALSPEQDNNSDGAGGAKRGGPKSRAGSEEAPARTSVPQPDPPRVLQVLKAMEHSYDGRWLQPSGAVEWILSKLAQAEGLWAETEPPHIDYALVMEGEQDEAFFMTDYAQELLEAAGIRNDLGDFYKVPGNSTPTWRGSMRAALEEGLQRLDTPEAEDLYVQLRRREAEMAEEARNKAAAAEIEAARLRAMNGFGSAASRGKPSRKLSKKQQEEQAQQELLQDSDAGSSNSSSSDAEPPAPAAARSKKGGSAQPRAGSEDEGGSSDGGSSSSSSGLGDSDAGEEDARALPHFSDSDAEAQQQQQQQQQQQASRAKRPSQRHPQSRGSDDDGDGEAPAAASPAKKKSRPAPPAPKPSSRSKHTSATATATAKPSQQPKRKTSTAHEPTGAARADHGDLEDDLGGSGARSSRGAAGNDSQEEPGTTPSQPAGREKDAAAASRHERVLWGGGQRAQGRKAALAALAARRGGVADAADQGGSQGSTQAGTQGSAHAPPRERSLNVAAGAVRAQCGGGNGGHEKGSGGGDGGGGKKRRLQRGGGGDEGGKAASQAAAGATQAGVGKENEGAAGAQAEDMLEDF